MTNYEEKESDYDDIIFQEQMKRIEDRREEGIRRIKAEYDEKRHRAQQQHDAKIRQLEAKKQFYQREKERSYQEKVRNLTIPMAHVRAIETNYEIFQLYNDLLVKKEGDPDDLQQKIDDKMAILKVLQSGIADGLAHGHDHESFAQLVDLIWHQNLWGDSDSS